MKLRTTVIGWLWALAQLLLLVMGVFLFFVTESWMTLFLFAGTVFCMVMNHELADNHPQGFDAFKPANASAIFFVCSIVLACIPIKSQLGESSGWYFVALFISITCHFILLVVLAEIYAGRPKSIAHKTL